MTSKLKKLFDLSLLKTLRINLHYFSLRDAVRFPILVSRCVKLRIVKGNVRFDCPVTTGLVKIGFDTLGLADPRYDRAIWEVQGDVTFKGRADFGAGSKIIVMGGKLVVGERFSITGLSRVIVAEKVTFGDDVLISWDVQIMDTDFHKIRNAEGVIINPPKAIEIGDNVWIGSKVTVLKGVIVKNGGVIAANSLVSKDCGQPNAIYGGIPATIIKERITWEI